MSLLYAPCAVALGTRGGGDSGTTLHRTWDESLQPPSSRIGILCVQVSTPRRKFQVRLNSTQTFSSTRRSGLPNSAAGQLRETPSVHSSAGSERTVPWHSGLRESDGADLRTESKSTRTFNLRLLGSPSPSLGAPFTLTRNLGERPVLTYCQADGKQQPEDEPAHHFRGHR